MSGQMMDGKIPLVLFNQIHDIVASGHFNYALIANGGQKQCNEYDD